MNQAKTSSGRCCYTAKYEARVESSRIQPLTIKQEQEYQSQSQQDPLTILTDLKSCLRELHLSLSDHNTQSQIAAKTNRELFKSKGDIMQHLRFLLEDQQNVIRPLMQNEDSATATDIVLMCYQQMLQQYACVLDIIAEYQIEQAVAKELQNKSQSRINALISSLEAKIDLIELDQQQEEHDTKLAQQIQWQQLLMSRYEDEIAAMDARESQYSRNLQHAKDKEAKLEETIASLREDLLKMNAKNKRYELHIETMLKQVSDLITVNSTTIAQYDLALDEQSQQIESSKLIEKTLLGSLEIKEIMLIELQHKAEAQTEAMHQFCLKMIIEQSKLSEEKLLLEKKTPDIMEQDSQTSEMRSPMRETVQDQKKLIAKKSGHISSQDHRSLLFNVQRQLIMNHHGKSSKYSNSFEKRSRQSQANEECNKSKLIQADNVLRDSSKGFNNANKQNKRQQKNFSAKREIVSSGENIRTQLIQSIR